MPGQITTTNHDTLFVTTDEHYGESAYNGLRRVPLLRGGQSIVPAPMTWTIGLRR